MLPTLVLVLPLLAAPTVRLSPATMTVQEKTTLDYIVEVGPEGLATGDRIRVEDPLFHGMTWSKWGCPTLQATQCSPLETGQGNSRGLVSATTSGAATVSTQRVLDDETGYTGCDINKRTYTQVTVESGALVQGDTVTVRFGDLSGGPDCGQETPDRAFDQVLWRADVRQGATWTPIEPAPTFEVLATPEVHTLWAVAPSVVQVGSTVSLKVVPVDYLGNPVRTWTGTVTLDGDHGGQSHTFKPSDLGFYDFSVTLDTVGIHRVQVTAPGFSVTSNPIEVLEEAPDLQLYWMDIHNHHGNAYTDEDGALVDENFVYARDIAGIHIASQSEKGLPTELDAAEIWAQLSESCLSYSVDDRFLVIQGWEWVGDLANRTWYHHNTYYDACDGPQGDHDTGPTVLGGEDGLFAWVHEVEETYGLRALTLPHATNSTGYDWDSQDPELRRLVEVYSEWGDNMKEDPADASSWVPEGLARGNRMGFFASSDNHDGWMGNPYTFNSTPSGLGAVWAPALTRSHIFQALYDRQTFGTSAIRSIVRFTAEDGATVQSGTEYVAGSPTFRWSYHGTDTLRSITLKAVPIHEGAQVITLTSEAPGGLDRVDGSYAWTDYDGADIAVWLEVEQEDDEKTWASPIFLTTDCSRLEATDPADRCGRDTSETGRDDTSTHETGGDTGKPRTRCLGCASAQHGGAGFLVALVALLARRKRRP